MPSNPVLADQAYQKLRTAIVNGDLRPNQRLVEADVCELISIGRTPVRTALQMLADHGFIVKQRSSWVVREFDAADIRDVYESRMALEGFAARLAAERASDEQLEAIAKILRRHANLEMLPPLAQVDLNEEFHEAISAASGNQQLVLLIRRNRQFAFDNHAARLYSEEDYREGHEGHRAIVDALLRRDGDAVEAKLRAHHQRAMDKFLTQMDYTILP